MIPRGVFLTAVLVVGGIAAATGAIPSGDQVISGCFIKATGALRVVDADAAQKCKSNEAPLSWNQVGLKGEPGDVGPAGPAGEQGPAGAPGASGAQEVFFNTLHEVRIEPLGFFRVAELDLPAGSYILEGQVTVEVRADDYPFCLFQQSSDGDTIGTLMGQRNPVFSSSGKAMYQIQLKVAATRPAGKVSIACASGENADAKAWANFLATRVASVG